MVKKACFMNKDRPCDLTCKAAFEVDDPVDNVDCYFIWLAYHFGEGLYDMRQMLESGLAGGLPGMPSPGTGPGPGAPGPGGTHKGPPKGFSQN